MMMQYIFSQISRRMHSIFHCLTSSNLPSEVMTKENLNYRGKTSFESDEQQNIQLDQNDIKVVL